ncbi:MAG: 1,4-dihydroxy-2-naphthoate polyprenyltransferase [Ignavibacteriae bacterium]|nr:1,4-dihydroxy-2-naphthoate polyprenyltransferase [Ignavibacteriota bacterium]
MTRPERTDPEPPSLVHAWVLAARPKTLPASAVPVFVGSAVAAAEGRFALLPAAIALVCALLIQVGVNLANDYFDFLKGADTDKRLGPVRVTQSGLIPPRTVRAAMILVLGITFVLGLVLVARAGWPILVVGLVSIFCAVIYTAGPFALAYNGLGDIFVFVFFGVVAVTCTHYVQALEWSRAALLASLPLGAISTAILVVNNYRDIDTDTEAGKRTLAVRLGRQGTRYEFKGLLAFAWLAPLAQVLGSGASHWLLLPLLSVPLGVRIARVLDTRPDGPALNRALAATGQLLVVYGLLLATGVLASAR